MYAGGAAFRQLGVLFRRRLCPLGGWEEAALVFGEPLQELPESVWSASSAWRASLDCVRGFLVCVDGREGCMGFNLNFSGHNPWLGLALIGDTMYRFANPYF